MAKEGKEVVRSSEKAKEGKEVVGSNEKAGKKGKEVVGNSVDIMKVGKRKWFEKGETSGVKKKKWDSKMNEGKSESELRKTERNRRKREKRNKALKMKKKEVSSSTVDIMGQKAKLFEKGETSKIGAAGKTERELRRADRNRRKKERRNKPLKLDLERNSDKLYKMSRSIERETCENKGKHKLIFEDNEDECRTKKKRYRKNKKNCGVQKREEERKSRKD
ncbi:protein MNN4-like [Vicia villosa]|uniref:protein MNN4-like n=1 Tax=Vicia villosa TaxID=3911 RepID=UPI00273BB644|nr:protein MNN4-like [Vicia villosa]